MMTMFLCGWAGAALVMVIIIILVSGDPKKAPRDLPDYPGLDSWDR